MGLEAGWNCHISLLAEKSCDDDEAAADFACTEMSQGYGSLVNVTATTTAGERTISNSASSHNNQLALPIDARLSASKKPRIRSSSAPNMMVYHAQGGGEHEHRFVDYASNNVTPRQECQDVFSSDVPHCDSNDERSCMAPLLQHQKSWSVEPSGAGKSRRRRSSSRSVSGTDLSHVPGRSFRKGRHDSEFSDRDNEQIRIVIHQEDEEDGKHNAAARRMSAGSYMMSRKSSYSESIPGVSGLSNRARLPKGIANIRSHIDNVDNVPLLVSLFTDSTPVVTKEMLHILQDYGEVACCFGSIANIENTSIFLQADCSISIEPQYPQICIRHRVIEKVPSRSGSMSPTSGCAIGPMELSSTLHSLPCSLSLTADDHITVIQSLVALARHHCQRVRGVMLLYIKCQVGLSLLQLINCLCLLPPALSPQLVLWLSVIIVPLLSFTLMGNPFNRIIAQMAQGKNNARIVKQTLMEEFAYFSVRFIPSLLVCIGCFAANLYSFCGEIDDGSSTNVTSTECELVFGYVQYNVTGTWNGWSTEYRPALVISQQFVAFQLVIYFVLISLCSIHPFDYLWRKTPFNNRLWCVVTPTIVLLQMVCFAVATSQGGNTGASSFSLGKVPIVTWIVAFTWPVGLIALCELVKRHEIKMWVRHQKRARLDFGTKLGMNSPF